jgi:alpha-L-arabinofuranosidase
VHLDDEYRFEVFGLGNEEFGAVVLKCLRCVGWQVETDTTSDTLTLAELVQRADEHTEVCR